MLGRTVYLLVMSGFLISRVYTGTKYNVYRHSKTSEYVVRTLSYSLPTVLSGHVDVVAPTTYFGTMRSMKATSFKQPDIKPVDSNVNVVVDAVDAASCSSTVTPSCLRALYKTASYKPAATNKNSIGIAGYLEEYASFADLQVRESPRWTFSATSHRDYCIRRFSRSSVLMLLVVISPLWRSREARMTSQTPVPKQIWTCSTVSVYRIPRLTYSTGKIPFELI
jgi:hypothetical protein